MRYQVVFFSLIGLLSGCGSVSTLSREEVRAMSDASICYANFVAPVGFIPLELNRREKDPEKQLDCRDHDESILKALVEEEERSIISKPVIPAELLNRNDCKGVRLGDTRNEKTVKGTLFSPNSGTTTTSGFYQYVHNERRQTTYILLNTFSNDFGNSRRLIVVPPGSSELVRFGPTNSYWRVSIQMCRAFS
jgi:hypothetical protein